VECILQLLYGVLFNVFKVFLDLCLHYTSIMFCFLPFKRVLFRFYIDSKFDTIILFITYIICVHII